MAKKKVDIKWYVLNQDFNKRQIVSYNVITEELIDRIYKLYKKGEIKKLKDLEQIIDVYCTHRYRYRTECEIIVLGLFDELEEGTKIDIYNQLEKNIPTITQYINYKMELGLK